MDYLADLGIDTVWLSPIFRSPMRDFGYDVCDYCDVDPVFGTLDDLDELIAVPINMGRQPVPRPSDLDSAYVLLSTSARCDDAVRTLDPDEAIVLLLGA